MTDEMHKKLLAPFPERDVDWRIGSAVATNDKKDIEYATALAYIDARAVQERLDEVFGFMGWQTKVTQVTGGFLCELSVWDPFFSHFIPLFKVRCGDAQSAHI